jgi:hypothetical protein
MTKTTRDMSDELQRINRQAMGPKPADRKIEVGSDESGFDEPPAFPKR